MKKAVVKKVQIEEKQNFNKAKEREGFMLMKSMGHGLLYHLNNTNIQDQIYAYRSENMHYNKQVND
uniref:Uncharacterized protein n=1 Tax=Romanomermis culicivorax TaxID=13658 RepID=A0A915KNE9_ROMCU